MYEKVNPAHSDKVADRIAGAIVDLAYAKEKDLRIAVEVLLGHGICHIMAETSVHFTSDEISRIVQRIAPELMTDYLDRILSLVLVAFLLRMIPRELYSEQDG